MIRWHANEDGAVGRERSTYEAPHADHEKVEEGVCLLAKTVDFGFLSNSEVAGDRARYVDSQRLADK